MNIGEKIKKLRTAKLMTQSELVGNEITRNMLSRIENGTANPSLETILYIASRLNVSAGFLLAEEGDEQIYYKHQEIVGIKKAFSNREYRICRDICLNSESVRDDEIQMILAECNLALGIEEFNRGNLRVSCEYFDEALENREGTQYRTEYVIAVAGVYFRYMRRLSATLSSNVIDESDVNVYPALTDDFCRYATAMEMSESEGEGSVSQEGRALMETIESPNPFVLHYEARERMAAGEYAGAYEKLRRILLEEFAVPEPVLYHTFCDLEIACREIGDFKGAYEYSIDKIEFLQKLLT